MKKIFAAISILLLASFVSIAQVQPFGTPVNVLGTSNSVPVATNIFSFPVRQISFIQASGGTNANTTFIGNVFLSITNGAAGGLNVTNSILVGSLTNAVGTGSFTTNLQSFLASLQITMWVQAQSTTNGGASNSVIVTTSAVGP